MALFKGIGQLWPSIVDIPSAKKASRQGVWASAWCAGATIILVILNILGLHILDFDMLALVDAFFFVIIGWGIFKMNRIAAGAGLFLYILERIVMWAEHGFKNPVLAILISLAFINSIRGVFAYHNPEMFKADEAKPRIQLPKILTCGHCGAESNAEGYRLDSPEWICSQCKEINSFPLQ